MRAAQQLKYLDRTTEAILQKLARWNPVELNRPAREGGWTALEIIAHLCQVEKAFVSLVQRSSGTSRTVGLKERMGALVVIAVMRLPVRVKVPAGTPVEEKPAGRDSLADARSSWLDTRAEVKRLLAASTVDRKAGVFRHPVSGWMTIDLAIGFLAAHCRHHLYQVNRLRKSLEAGF